MAHEDEDVFGNRPKPPVTHEVGQVLDTLSVHELDEQHARVFAGRDEKFAQAFAVALGAAIFKMSELSDALHQKADFFAKFFFY